MMSIYEVKVVFCGYCAVVKSPSICVIIFICGHLIASSSAENSSMMFDSIQSPSYKNLSHKENQTSVKTREPYSMNNIEKVNDFSKQTDIRKVLSDYIQVENVRLNFHQVKKV